MADTARHDTKHVSEPTVTEQHRTPEQRAKWALRRACNGWRKNRQCRGPDGTTLKSPHPGCVRAQEEHDHILRLDDQL